MGLAKFDLWKKTTDVKDLNSIESKSLALIALDPDFSSGATNSRRFLQKNS